MWVEWLRGRERDAAEASRGRFLFMPAIVAMELLSGVVDRASERIVEGLIEPFALRKRLVVPDESDYRRAGRALSDLRLPASSKSNDALIAVAARRIGAEIWTKNMKDFQPLCGHFKIPLIAAEEITRGSG